MKDIKNYEGLYAVTSCGKVWSYRSQKFLSPRVKENGYLEVVLSKDGVKKAYLIHRLIAETFIPNPDNKPTVNHKDENKSHNYINNLEWMTSAENNAYGSRTQKTCKPVYCIELDKVFNGGASEAAKELNIKSQSNISAVCLGKRKTCGGYHWRYADELLGEETGGNSREVIE